MNWILLFILVIGALVVIGFLMKSFIKVILILAIIYLLFHLGFLWGADDLNEKLHLNKLFKPEVNEQIQDKYDNFKDKREQNGVVQTDLIKQTINNSIQSALTKASNEIKSVDRGQLVQDLNNKLKNFDTKEVSKVLDDLKNELGKYGLTPQDIEQSNTNK